MIIINLLVCLLQQQMQNLIRFVEYIYKTFCQKKQKKQQQSVLIELQTLKQQQTTKNQAKQHITISKQCNNDKGRKQQQLTVDKRNSNNLRRTIRQYQKNNFKDQQFYSIDSYYGEVNSNKYQLNMNENNQKLQKGRLTNEAIKYFNSIKSVDERNELMKYSSYRWGQLNNDFSYSLKEEAQDMLTWMEHTYPLRINHKNIRISYAIRLKVQGKEMLKLLVHKLQDFKIFYLSQSKQTLFKYTNARKTLQAYFKTNDLGSSTIKGSKIMSFYRIQCSTVNIGKILKMFKSESMFNIMHQFKNIVIVNNNGMGLHLQFPVVEVEEMGNKIKEQKLFHLGFQLGQIQCKEERGDKQLIEIVYSLDEGQRSFQRILKIQQGQKGSIQIYTESSQEVVCSYVQYFQSKFKSLSKNLVKNNIIKQ